MRHRFQHDLFYFWRPSCQLEAWHSGTCFGAILYSFLSFTVLSSFCPCQAIVSLCYSVTAVTVCRFEEARFGLQIFLLGFGLCWIWIYSSGGFFPLIAIDRTLQYLNFILFPCQAIVFFWPNHAWKLKFQWRLPAVMLIYWVCCLLACSIYSVDLHASVHAAWLHAFYVLSVCMFYYSVSFTQTVVMGILYCFPPMSSFSLSTIII